MRVIRPLNPPRIKIRRLGKVKPGYVRPLRVTFPSKCDAIDILKKKSICSGPVKIAQDRTSKQREYFKEIKIKLQSLKDSGVEDVSIQYVNGVPTIKKVNNFLGKKNGVAAL